MAPATTDMWSVAQVRRRWHTIVGWRHYYLAYRNLAVSRSLFVAAVVVAVGTPAVAVLWQQRLQCNSHSHRPPKIYATQVHGDSVAVGGDGLVAVLRLPNAATYRWWQSNWVDTNRWR